WSSDVCSSDLPHLWDVNDPALYTVRAAVESEGRRDEAETVHGFRTVAVHAERGFLLNGRVVKVHGVCCHQGHGGMGIALPDSIIAMRMQKLQEIGINADRKSTRLNSSHVSISYAVFC